MKVQQRFLSALLLFVFLSALFLSCKKIRIKDDEFHLERKDYTGNELRMDGYFYTNFNNNAEVYGSPIFFYRNGVLVNLGSFKMSEQDTWEGTINNDAIDIARDYKESWGIFLVEGNTIRTEQWYRDGGSWFLHAYVKEGVILNDTTFKFTSSYRLTNRGRKKEIEVENETYYFKQFSPKPDSTNSYID
jgi:hypothetical protein